MEKDIRQLKEGYERRLTTANNEIKKIEDEDHPGKLLSHEVANKYIRLNAKSSCYRTIITELERILLEEKV